MATQETCFPRSPRSRFVWLGDVILGLGAGARTGKFRSGDGAPRLEAAAVASVLAEERSSLRLSFRDLARLSR